MKTNISFKRHFIIMSLSVAISSLAFVWPCTGEEFDKIVQKAYDLRMQGKVDESKTLLEQAIS